MSDIVNRPSNRRIFIRASLKSIAVSPVLGLMGGISITMLFLQHEHEFPFIFFAMMSGICTLLTLAILLIAHALSSIDKELSQHLETKATVGECTRTIETLRGDVRIAKRERDAALVHALPDALFADIFVRETSEPYDLADSRAEYHLVIFNIANKEIQIAQFNPPKRGGSAIDLVLANGLFLTGYRHTNGDQTLRFSCVDLNPPPGSAIYFHRLPGGETFRMGPLLVIAHHTLVLAYEEMVKITLDPAARTEELNERAAQCSAARQTEPIVTATA